MPDMRERNNGLSDRKRDSGAQSIGVAAASDADPDADRVERREIEALTNLDRQPPDSVHHRRHEVEPVDPVLLDEREHGRRVEATAVDDDATSRSRDTP